MKVVSKSYGQKIKLGSIEPSEHEAIINALQTVYKEIRSGMPKEEVGFLTEGDVTVVGMTCCGGAIRFCKYTKTSDSEGVIEFDYDYSVGYREFMKKWVLRNQRKCRFKPAYISFF